VVADDWRVSAARRAQVAAIAAAAYPIVAGLGRTLRWRVEGTEHLAAVAASGHPPILAFWHGRILPATIYFRDRGIVVITSENFDGEWIARIIARFGYGTARGSTSRGGRRALLQLVRDMRAGRSAAFTLDGPRGPAQTAQPGAVWLAKASGCPVVPFHMEASSCWTARSWDRTQVPKPFSTIGVAIGAPLHVPGDASEAMLEDARVEVERRLAGLQARALALSRTEAAPRS
jgi:lysophospholipid acyltransferase (LPLAT)-like uncharacterized protein